MSATATTCAGCNISLRKMRTSCFWCGSALHAGRTPSDRERYETSAEARDARLMEIESARRDPDSIDQIVAVAIAAKLKPFEDFTHEHLLTCTGLNPCAIKHALMRLARIGRVRASGQARLRANRFRTVWQALPPLYGMPAASDSAANAAR